MRVLVTGAGGFVGRWTVAELQHAGHEVIAAPPSRELDIADARAVAALLARVQPEGIVHLAGLSFGPDATRDPAEAVRVNAGGTRALLRSLPEFGPSPVVVVAGSSEVYGVPEPRDLPLTESAPVAPVSDYGRSKLQQEEVALDVARATGIPTVVTRSFNHTGPGQRSDFVAPALGQRILAARASSAHEIRVGNIDVRRDLSDVRDVARAYRKILEGLSNGSVATGVLNVCSGRSVAIREVIRLLAEIAGFEVTPRIDPALVRAVDAPEIVGDPSRLRDATGWEPMIPLRQTLSDLVEELETRDALREPAAS